MKPVEYKMAETVVNGEISACLREQLLQVQHVVAMGMLFPACYFFPCFLRNQESGILSEILNFKMAVVHSNVLRECRIQHREYG